MRIDVRFRGLRGSPQLVEMVTQRVHRRLSHFDSQLSDIVLRISDENGPKGGMDKRCHFVVRGPRLGALNLTQTHAEVLSGVDLGLDRLAHLVGRTLERAAYPRLPLKRSA